MSYKGIDEIRSDVLDEFREAGSRHYGRTVESEVPIRIGRPGARYDIAMGQDGEPQVIYSKDPRRNMRRY